MLKSRGAKIANDGEILEEIGRELSKEAPHLVHIAKEVVDWEEVKENVVGAVLSIFGL